MRFPNREVVERLKERYPAGTRVELVEMNDPQAPPIGTRGTVIGVDDIGSIMVSWDNGSGLNVAYGEDRCRKIDENICPVCGKEYTERPALSRKDNKTFICPDCGLREALESIGMDEKDQDEILDRIHSKLMAEGTSK